MYCGTQSRVSETGCNAHCAQSELGTPDNRRESQRQSYQGSPTNIDEDFVLIICQTLSIRSLTQLVPLYPSLHKALSQRLFALCHQIFSGSVHQTTDSLPDAAANLYAVLHFIGGKVGGTNLWRNCLDEILQFSWSAWLTLRTTFPTSAQLSHKTIAYLRSPDGNLPKLVSHADTTTDDPLATVALNLDRLKRGIIAISALLR